MTNKKKQRLVFFGGVFCAAAAAVALTLFALRGSITYFYLPSELAALDETPSSPIRLGGLVADGSVEYVKAATGDVVSFTVEDASASIRVNFAFAQTRVR